MKQKSFVLIALMWLAAPAAQSYVVPLVEQGTWLSSRMMPAAINEGDYTKIADLLTDETTVRADDGKVLAKGKAPTLAYLKEWYSTNNRVISTYSGYASLAISVERVTDRPWSKAYMLVISCASGKIVQIMIIDRNPNMP